MDPDLLFVYGTLRSNFANPAARMLRECAELLGPASVYGAIYSIDHYPGFRPDLPGMVRGELYRLQDPGTLELLDQYEGEEFERVVVEIEGVRAWVYRYVGLVVEAQLIQSGDFNAP